jgi:hypothetical protein
MVSLTRSCASGTSSASRLAEGLVQREASAALRAGSLERLQAGFSRYVQAESVAPGWDPRDAMINMTPFVDCARRLGHDPASVLGPIAATGADWFRETFDSFARRTDVTLAAFGWSIAETHEGPSYRFAFPPD